MKSDGHLKYIRTKDVLQITTRSANRKRLNVFHNMNMQTEFVFAGGRDIKIDMSLCLCYKTLAWFGITGIYEKCFVMMLDNNFELIIETAFDYRTLYDSNLNLTRCMVIFFYDCWFALILILWGHDDLCGYLEIGLLILITMVGMVIVVIWHEKWNLQDSPLMYAFAPSDMMTYIMLIRNDLIKMHDLLAWWILDLIWDTLVSWLKVLILW